VGHVHDSLDMVMMYALAHSVTVVGAGKCHGEECLPCARVLFNRLGGA